MEQKVKNNKIKLRILIAILVLSAGSAIVFAAIILHDIITTRQGQDFFAQMSVPIVQLPVNPPQQNIVADDESNDDNIDTIAEEEPFLLPILDFEAKRELAPNIVGWIQSPGTVINYPIVQGADNDFYLDHLPNGRRNSMGSIFLDYRNEADFSSQNMFIYGHNMASGDKFSSLRQYENRAFFEQHSEMFIFTPHQNFVLEIFAGYNINSAIEHPPMYFESEIDFERYIENLRSRSFIRSDVQVSYNDQLVFLVTCVYADDNPWRSIIVGRIIALDW
ncbi:MAG: class B sortase [Defluviitaleaceae bacterium]|nr:class B sortase [Defluviitaleaceae bacterium]